MDFSFFNTPLGLAIIAPLGGFAGALFGVGISALTTRSVHRERVEADKELAERRFQFEKALALRKFDLDRQQMVQKRLFEIAEAVLSDTYRFRQLMVYVRNGYSMGGEGETRPSRPGESEDLARLRNSYFTPVERVMKESAFVNEMLARRFIARSHFGADAQVAFDNFELCIRRIQIAARALIDMAEGPAPDPSFRQKMQNDIWAAGEVYGGDELESLIAEGVALVEGFCRPVMEREGKSPEV